MALIKLCTPQAIPIAMVAKMNAISLGSEMLDLNRMMASAPNIPKLSARLSPMDCIMVAVMTDINMRD